MNPCRSATVWILLVCGLSPAYCQLATIEGFVGDSVVLPCVYNEPHPLPAGVSVFWRDRDDRIVLDIIRNSENRTSQNERFSRRVFSFPEQYKKGNFSIVMTTLRQADAGPYECHIPRVDFMRAVTVSVSGRRDVMHAPGGAAGIRPPHLALVAVPLFLLF